MLEKDSEVTRLLSLHPSLTVLIGNNGVGKTHILEALHDPPETTYYRARRVIRDLYQRREAPRVLIDEIELHLHPRAQQRILPQLQAAFPDTQFVVTTHSPLVLSTVDVSCIRLLRRTPEGLEVSQPRFQTRGVHCADILATLMEVDPIPDVEEARQLSRYRALVEDGLDDTEEGRRLYDALLGHFGASHPVMVDCERLRRRVTFKNRSHTSFDQLGKAVDAYREYRMKDDKSP